MNDLLGITLSSKKRPDFGVILQELSPLWSEWGKFSQEACRLGRGYEDCAFNAEKHYIEDVPIGYRGKAQSLKKPDELKKKKSEPD